MAGYRAIPHCEGLLRSRRQTRPPGGRSTQSLWWLTFPVSKILADHWVRRLRDGVRGTRRLLLTPHGLQKTDCKALEVGVDGSVIQGDFQSSGAEPGRAGGWAFLVMDVNRDVSADRSHIRWSLKGSWEIRSNYSFLFRLALTSRLLCRGGAVLSPGPGVRQGSIPTPSHVSSQFS